MSEKRKSTPKAKVLTAVLLVLFLGSCATLVFAVCTDILGVNNNRTNPTETVSATETTVAEETTAQPETTEAVITTIATTASEAQATGISLGSTYNVDYWAEYQAEHNASGLAVLFGARTQGAVISFDNGRFTVSSVSNDEYTSVATGSYSLISDSEIELRYDNSYIAAAIVAEAEDGVATALDFPLDVEGTTLRASLSE